MTDTSLVEVTDSYMVRTFNMSKLEERKRNETGRSSDFTVLLL